MISKNIKDIENAETLELLLAYKTKKCSSNDHVFLMNQENSKFFDFLTVKLDELIEHMSLFQTCTGYHNENERRRQPFDLQFELNYSFYGCFHHSSVQDNCSKSHNYFEMQFHPLRYKTIECANFKNCPFTKRKFCPYFHFDEKSRIEIVALWNEMIRKKYEVKKNKINK